MAIVYFIYGTAFFVFGNAILFQMHYDRRALLGKALWMLGAFGITHGISEWLDMFKVSSMYGPMEHAWRLEFTALVFKVSSFLLLAVYGLASLAEFRALHPRWAKRIMGALLLLPTVAFLLMKQLSADPTSWVEITPLARESLLLPGAIAAAVTLHRIRNSPGITRLSDGKYNLAFSILIAAFVFYAIFAGVCTEPGRLFPSNVINTATFHEAFGFPVQLIRAACAVCSAVGVTRILRLLEKDVSARLASERDAAIQADKAKSVFLANISHELRTPMHGILSFARFGQKKTGTVSQCELKSYFDEIYDSGSRLMILLNDLLDLSKLEVGKVVYSMREDDLVSVARAVRAEMSAFARERKVAIEIDAPSAEVIGVFDTERVMQVFRNIVSNAIKFSDAGTSISIRPRVASDSGTVRCCVANRGIGIPSTELESVFDKFAQSSKTRTGAGGTGLGLAICKEIIQQHGGRIWAESEPGGETRIIFEWPQRRRETELKAA